MGSKDKIHGFGAILVVFAMAGFAEISTSSHGSFWFCSILLAAGIGCCLAGYKK